MRGVTERILGDLDHQLNRLRDQLIIDVDDTAGDDLDNDGFYCHHPNLKLLLIGLHNEVKFHIDQKFDIALDQTEDTRLVELVRADQPSHTDQIGTNELTFYFRGSVEQFG